MTSADGAVTRQQWNGLGQLTQVIDPKGVSTGYSVNAFGEVAVESSPDIGAITYERDAAGRITAMTDAVGVPSGKPVMHLGLTLVAAPGSRLNLPYATKPEPWA